MKLYVGTRRKETNPIAAIFYILCHAKSGQQGRNGLAYASSWGFGMLPTGQTPILRKMSPESLMKPDPYVTLSPSTTHSPRVTFDSNRSGKKLVQ